MPRVRTAGALRWICALCVVVGCGPASTPSATAPIERSALRETATTPAENLLAFARLYGYVRFFHPTDAAAQTQWQAFAAQGVAYVHDAPNLGVLTERLEALFGPRCADLQLWVEGEPEPPPPVPPRRTDTLVYWQYQGFEGSPVHLYRPPYDRVRVGAGPRATRHFPAEPSTRARIDTVLLGALRVRLPVVLDRPSATRPASKPLPRLDPVLAEAATSPEGYHQEAVRLGAVIEVWNVLRHFYPYQSVVQEDWENLLLRSLEDARDDVSLDDTIATLGRLVHAIGDGHADVGHPRYRRGALPIRIEHVGGRVLVTASEVAGIRIGDEVLGIDSEPVDERIARLQERLSGSSQWRRFKATTWMATRGPRGTHATVQLARGEDRFSVKLPFSRSDVPPPVRPPALHTFDDGVIYLDLVRNDWSDLEAHLPELTSAPGLVIDVRGYPDDGDDIIDYLLSEPEDALWLHVPRIVEPDGKVCAWHEIGWHRRPASTRIDAPVAFLISPEAISYAESILSYVEAHDLGTLVGSATAGANGDIVRLDTLGGLHVIFTGMRVTRHDGSNFHLEGIRPDVPVERSPEAVARGEDEVLQAALEIVRRQQATEASSAGTTHASP